MTNYKENEYIRSRVRQQYERYPYPDLDPETGKGQMLVSGHLSLMCEMLWAGKKSPDGLRVLDAGCGTGGPLVGMARAYPQADIVGVDFSEASLEKARRLAQRMGVKNVRFHHLPIEKLPELGLTFDFVVSSGVLHHLPDPAEGLAAINQVLDPQGAVSIMLYGKYGRTGIYMLQDALSKMFPGDVPVSERIPIALKMARGVPNHHPMALRQAGRELQEGKDAGIVDLLLHANDIPFDVPAVYHLCENAGMRFHRWLFPLIYKPVNYFKNTEILDAIGSFSASEQQEIAELVHGRNSKHSFFAVGPDFIAPAISTNGGNWRNLYARLTPCSAWDRTTPLPGKNGVFVVPNAVVQDAWEPLQLSQWQLVFLAHILPDRPLGQIIQNPTVKRLLPFSSSGDMDRAVEKLLAKVLDISAIVLLEKPGV